jgi:thiamine-monophosphate kinase
VNIESSRLEANENRVVLQPGAFAVSPELSSEPLPSAPNGANYESPGRQPWDLTTTEFQALKGRTKRVRPAPAGVPASGTQQHRKNYRMGELSLIEKFKAGAPGHPWITVGPGSDCAVLNWPGDVDQLFKIDQVIEGTHFVLSGPEAATPFQVGWKAMAKTCSDIAAAGGWPVAAMVAMNVRKGSADEFVMQIYKGIVSCCEDYRIGLAGGDFSSSENGLCITVSLLGRCEKGKSWTRSGGRPGDVLFITGPLAGSLPSKKHLTFSPRLDEAKWLRSLLKDGVRACIDITDGLSRDLGHLCKESLCGARIFEAKVPVTEFAAKNSTSARDAFRHALSDGEDFELLIAVDPNDALILKEVMTSIPGLFSGLSDIGVLTPLELGVTCVSTDGTEQPLPDLGYEHVV